MKVRGVKMKKNKIKEFCNLKKCIFFTAFFLAGPLALQFKHDL